MDLNGCIPKDKFDTAAIERARQIGFPALNPVVPDLLAWIQDANWPVAPRVGSLLSDAGPEILPFIRAVLNGDDAVWKRWTIELVLKDACAEVIVGLCEEIERLASHPTQAEHLEEVDVVARSILGARRPA